MIMSFGFVRVDPSAAWASLYLFGTRHKFGFKKVGSWIKSSERGPGFVS